MNAQIVFAIVAILIMAFIVSLLRSRRLREKYAALWIVVGVVGVLLSLFPDLLGWLAGLLGVQVPSNLLFALALVLLLGVSLHLSLEISRSEDETRILAEHVAVLNLIVKEAGLLDQISGAPGPLAHAGDKTTSSLPDQHHAMEAPAEHEEEDA